MLLFMFKPVILLFQSFIFVCTFRKKVNISCNSWITSYPYPHYNFTERFLILIYFVFFVISRCVAEYCWNFKILIRFEKKGRQNDECLNMYTINTIPHRKCFSYAFVVFASEIRNSASKCQFSPAGRSLI